MKINFELSTLFTDKVIILQSQKKWSKSVRNNVPVTATYGICQVPYVGYFYTY